MPASLLARSGPVRLVVADDALLVREALTAMVQGVYGFRVEAVCEDYPSLMKAARETQPDVVITDIRMPPTHTDEGIRAAVELRSARPDLGVVILSQYAEPSYVFELLRFGSEGVAYLLKDRLHTRRELVSAVRTVATGGSIIDPKVVELLVAARERPTHSPLAQLSARERQILAEIATGKGNAAIANKLRLSKRSVEKHIHSIFSKLELVESEDVSRRVKATLIFLADDGEAIHQ